MREGFSLLPLPPRVRGRDEAGLRWEWRWSRVMCPSLPSFVIPLGDEQILSVNCKCHGACLGFFSYARPVRHRKIRDVDTELYRMTSRVSRADWIATVLHVHCRAANWFAPCPGGRIARLLFCRGYLRARLRIFSTSNSGQNNRVCVLMW